eukprot:CAMPEP_0204398398 /NCGR_PEP_ID=MMETSP0470-20130426/2767_1 /ASSEMBLY_ACC=CAM_ASM_000385 /TAXON_ID=2969 /ORGANISM="Oxyrrhis marina" /LENGTH=80 /DNA_ID=CAMNT_0051392995 /DNA_START=21 /DNA_END=259 /DNA_ORIENTATION=+
MTPIRQLRRLALTQPRDTHVPRQLGSQDYFFFPFFSSLPASGTALGSGASFACAALAAFFAPLPGMTKADAKEEIRQLEP